MEKFKTNSVNHSVSTRNRYNLHVPYTNLSKYQKGVYYSGIKLFNKLPPNIKSLNDDIKCLSQHLKSITYLTPTLQNLPHPTTLSHHKNVSSNGGFFCYNNFAVML
jgi:hypothetical protein